ncbi:SCAN domain-containing protein 3 [Takifugu flavidus]|uniref:SCAN domain-containing protein 3 n=1 Tax=Takifugu flavidus TaxID=433684 RepID=A0A5C6P4B1_9TELE|nr:SCAN domain-containing protein 3 [Takifugu flavidus]
MSGNLADQLDRDLARCRWFSIQCDESVDSSSTAQLMIFMRKVFDDFSAKEELLTLLPLKTTTRGVDIYNAVKEFLVEKKVPLEKLVSVTTDGAPAMSGRHTGSIVHCKGDTEFPNFLHYHCIIHQQALCAKVIGFEHVMIPVVKIINSIRSRAKQHRTFKAGLSGFQILPRCATSTSPRIPSIHICNPKLFHGDLNKFELEGSLKVVFKHLDHFGDAITRFLSLCQGNRAVEDFSVEFWTLVADSGGRLGGRPWWQKPPLRGVFLQRLSECLQD